jgi:mitogen-activated protein kinase organizer 1
MEVSHPNAADNLPSKPIARLVGHDGPISAIKYSHDGKYCISAGHDRTVRLWNPARIDPAYVHQYKPSVTSSPMPIDSLPHALPIQSYTDGHTHTVSSIDIDDTSTTLLSSSSKSLIVTDVITQKMKRRYQGHQGLINSVACSSGGSVFAFGSYDGTVHIIDGRSFSNTPIQVLSEATDSISCVKILENGNTMSEIVTVSVDAAIRTYDLRKGCIKVDRLSQDDAMTKIAFTSDWLCSAVSTLNGAIHVLEKETGTLINTCYGGHEAGRYSLDCAITSDDQHIVSGSEDGIAVLYDFASGDIVQRLKGHTRATCALTTHPRRDHESVVITGSYDGEAVVWSNGNPTYFDIE